MIPTNIPFDVSVLEPGDKLLYYTEDFVDFVIAEKTGKKVGHIEVYFGQGQSTASRNGAGVNIYPLRLDGLICVRRPRQSLDLDAAKKWFNETAKGQAYDFKGLLTATSLVRYGEDGKMFCSEYALNWDRAAKFEPFNPDQLACDTYPRDYWANGLHQTVWRVSQDY
jgi:hypothetical protein